MKLKKVLGQMLAGLAVASLSTLVMAPLAGRAFDMRLATVCVLLVTAFAGLAILMHR